MVDALLSGGSAREGVLVRIQSRAQMPFQRSWRGIFYFERCELVHISEKKNAGSAEGGERLWVRPTILDAVIYNEKVPAEVTSVLSSAEFLLS